MKSTDQEKILAFLTTKADAKVDEICIGTKLSYMVIKGQLKALIADGKITESDKGGVVTYSITEKGKQSVPKAEQAKKEPVIEKSASKAIAKPVAKAEPPVTPKNALKQQPKNDDLGPKTFTGRDNSKYRFGEHRNLPKGRLVLALVRAYVEKNPKVSLTKLQEVFQSKEVQIRFGVLDDVKVAKSFTKNSVDRFFLKNDDLIKLANGTKIAVCNQWMPDSIAKILKLAGSLGFKVKVEEAAE